MAKALPSYERLHELFSYDKDTGYLTRNASGGNRKAGSTVGYNNGKGYLMTSVDGCYYMVHRIIWLMATGNDPGTQEVDHINRDQSDNRLDNLRCVTRQQNEFNKSFKGVSYFKPSGKYKAQIQVDRKVIYLGLYDCPLMARMAYEDAKKTLHKI